MAEKGNISVLVVDDSAVVRKVIRSLLEDAPDFRVMGTAADPYVAARKIAKEVPDVIVLDIEMPRMDGLTFLQKLMAQHPIPVLVFSSLTEQGSRTALKALELGAVEVFNKPELGNRGLNDEEFRIQFLDTIRAVSKAKVLRRSRKAAAVNAKRSSAQVRVPPKHSADAVMHYSGKLSMIKTTEKVVAIGASTGGTEAIRVILQALPSDSSGIVIVQHMPELFTRSFADRLNEICRITVKEARDGDTVLRGHALIAPGNKHMVLKRTGARYHVQIVDGELVNRHRPSVDVLFRSVAMYAGQNALGIILTGMGDDGAQGLSEMKASGAMTVAQDQRTSVVFGMPSEAIKRGGVSRVEPLDAIPPLIGRK